VLQDVDGNGVYELVVDTDFTWDQGVNHCRASWPVIYGWTGDAYTDVSTKHMRYYKQQIPILQAETPTTFQAPCLAAEIAKLQRFTGIDKTAGLSDAIKWSESNNPHDRGFAAPILGDIGTSEALTDLNILANDTDGGVRIDTKASLANASKRPPHAVAPVGIRTPAPASTSTPMSSPTSTPGAAS